MITSEASRHSSRRSLCAYSLNTGTRADDTIPPTSRSYSSVGRIAAASYALTNPVAPNKLALTVSRARPKMRLAMLPSAMIEAARAMRVVSPIASDAIDVSLGSRSSLIDAFKTQGGCAPPVRIVPHTAWVAKPLPPGDYVLLMPTVSVNDVCNHTRIAD